jgi:hypothetical protein
MIRTRCRADRGAVNRRRDSRVCAGDLARSTHRRSHRRSRWRDVLMATRSTDDAPAFFGQETRYGHRVFGAVIINALR